MLRRYLWPGLGECPGRCGSVPKPHRLASARDPDRFDQWRPWLRQVHGRAAACSRHPDDPGAGHRRDQARAWSVGVGPDGGWPSSSQTRARGGRGAPGHRPRRDHGAVPGANRVRRAVGATVEEVGITVLRVRPGRRPTDASGSAGTPSHAPAPPRTRGERSARLRERRPRPGLVDGPAVGATPFGLARGRFRRSRRDGPPPARTARCPSLKARTQ
jgi:hypothetical protein